MWVAVGAVWAAVIALFALVVSVWQYLHPLPSSSLRAARTTAPSPGAIWPEAMAAITARPCSVRVGPGHRHRLRELSGLVRRDHALEQQSGTRKLL